MRFENLLVAVALVALLAAAGVLDAAQRGRVGVAAAGKVARSRLALVAVGVLDLARVRPVLFAAAGRLLLL